MRHATVEQLSAYLDAEVTERERRTVDEHLRACESCRERLAGLRSVAAGLRSLETSRPPAELGYLVERRVATEGRHQTLSERLESTVRGLRLQPVLAPVFGVVLALAAILYLFAVGVARDQERPTRLIIGPAASGEAREEAAAVPAAEPVTPPLAAAAPAAPARAPAESRPGPVPEPAPAPAPAAAEGLRTAVAAAPSETREVAGRLFDHEGEWWVERGLPEGAAAERLDPAGLDAEAAAALEPFRELRRARLLHRGQVVEVLYPESAESPEPPPHR